VLGAETLSDDPLRSSGVHLAFGIPSKYGKNPSMAEHKNFWTGWRERLSALRNVPAVLRIVWDSGPAVVVFGLASRLLAALLPVALLWITKLIIDGIVHAVSTHQSVQPRFWWLVATEFSLAVLTSILTRAIDYSDSWLTNTLVTSAFKS